MPVIFWLAAMPVKSGFWATIFGGAAADYGNAVPGLVLGILIGKGVEERLEPGD